MLQEIDFYIIGSSEIRPNSKRTLYVDGTAGGEFREGVDGELSHWRPNRTEERYRAGTSTEICFKYLQFNKAIDYDLVINNHMDVDGVLSVFTLTHPTVALRYRKVIIEAAEAGDFWAWADGKALKLFQLLSLLFQRLQDSKISMEESYQRCFALILRILKSENDKSAAEKILRNQSALIEDGRIIREELNERVVSYHVPQKTFLRDAQKYLKTAKFSEPISERLAFWPQVRNRQDAQKLQLVSLETEKGVQYELWLPGYCWADTKGLWQLPGLQPNKHLGGYSQLEWGQLSEIVAGLNAQEAGDCHWNLFSGFDFWNTKNSRDFPIILSTMSEGMGSRLSVESVKNSFKELV